MFRSSFYRLGIVIRERESLYALAQKTEDRRNAGLQQSACLRRLFEGTRLPASGAPGVLGLVSICFIRQCLHGLDELICLTLGFVPRRAIALLELSDKLLAATVDHVQVVVS